MQLASVDDVVPPGVRSQPSPSSGVASRDHRAQLSAGREPEPRPLPLPAMPFDSGRSPRLPRTAPGPVAVADGAERPFRPPVGGNVTY